MICLIILLIPAIVFAQDDIFGYYESEYDHIQLTNKSYNFGYNKLRIDLESRPSDQVMIAGNINFQLYHGKTDWDLIDFVPESISANIGSSSFSLQDTLILDNIYQTVLQSYNSSILLLLLFPFPCNPYRNTHQEYRNTILS